MAFDVDLGCSKFRPDLLGLPEGYGTCRITAQDAYTMTCLNGIYRVDRVALAFCQAYRKLLCALASLLQAGDICTALDYVLRLRIAVA